MTMLAGIGMHDRCRDGKSQNSQKQSVLRDTYLTDKGTMCTTCQALCRPESTERCEVAMHNAHRLQAIRIAAKKHMTRSRGRDVISTHLSRAQQKSKDVELLHILQQYKL